MFGDTQHVLTGHVTDFRRSLARLAFLIAKDSCNLQLNKCYKKFDYEAAFFRARL